MKIKMKMKISIIIKELNDCLDEIIDKSKSFEDQIKSIKKVENLHDYYHVSNFGDKELKLKIFKLQIAHLSNIIDKNLFKQIFGHTFETLANKLINTTNKGENQIIVNNIEKKKTNFMKKKKRAMVMIMWSNWRVDWGVDLIDAIKLILDFNKTI